MRISELMTAQVISMRAEETVSLAARLLSRGNVGALPVCAENGRVLGIVTDRDLVTRCLALGKDPDRTPVEEVMSRHVKTLSGQAPAETALALMSREQIRRVPVTENGRLSGIVSLSDLSQVQGAEAALGAVSAGISRR